MLSDGLSRYSIANSHINGIFDCAPLFSHFYVAYFPLIPTGYQYL